MPDLSQSGSISYYQAADGVSDLTAGTWYLNHNKRHAFIIYGDNDSLNTVTEQIVTAPADSVSTVINDFSNKNNIEIFRTKTVNDDIDGENIELNLEDRIVTFVFDHSGSMTWNDNEGLRYTVARRMVNRLASTYPGDITFNVVKYEGTPIQTTLFPVLNSNAISGNDAVAIARTYFKDSEHHFNGIRVVRKSGSYPTGPLDGDNVSEGIFNKALDEDLTEGETYYYTVFTFDENFRFSDGVRIKGIPRQRTIPRGISNFQNALLIGTGAARDDNTIGLWHFDEGDGSISYDFSDSSEDLTISDSSPVWIDKNETPVGVSGIRFNGSTTNASTALTSSVALSDALTIMSWIFPYDNSSDQTIVARQSASATNYIFSINSSGGLSFSLDGSTFVSSTAGVIQENVWQNVSCVVDLVGNSYEFYVDGVSVGSGSFVSTSVTTGDMYVDVGYDRRGSLNRLFGKICELSIHDTNRDIDYILENSQPDEEDASPDNGDRLVVLTYDITEDFNFSGGYVKIIRNAFRSPSWDEDGDTIELRAASSGSFYVTDADAFVMDGTYYYRAFSQNSLGNFSYPEDSPVISVSIPSMLSDVGLDELSPELSAPVSFTSQPGNKKVYLTWQNITLDQRIARVRIYFADHEFPVTDVADISGGELIFEGSIDDEFFVHRDIGNNATLYYQIISVDRFGRLSDPVFTSAMPLSSLSDSTIPLLEVKNISYAVASNTALTINWDNPISFKSDLTTYFGKTVLIYGSLTDQFGQPITENAEIDLSIIPDISKKNSSVDVFDSTILTFDDNDAYTFSATLDSNGIIRGILKMTERRDILSSLIQATFTIKVRTVIPDVSSEINNQTGKYASNIFEFVSSPVSVTMLNPWEAEIFNRDSRKIKRDCDDEFAGFFGAELANEIFPTSKTMEYDGAYIRSTAPFVTRVQMSYNGNPIPSGTFVKTQIWNATSDLCTDDFEPSRTTLNTSLGISPVLTTTTADIDSLDQLGQPTGQTEKISYVDIPITPPDYPQAVLLFVEVIYSGYRSVLKQYIVFENILKLELTAKAPKANTTDVAEQFATAYLIDPDFPEDKTKHNDVSDFTIAKWELSLGDFGENRPFYSRDTVPNITGIYSYFRSGTARQVFFGPAVNVQPHYIIDPVSGVADMVGEKYTIDVSVLFDGLTQKQSKEVEIIPITSKSNYAPAKLLMEFSSYKNSLWADGTSYQKLLISRDPNSSATTYSGCFLQCADLLTYLVPILPEGQVIDISAGDPRIEILWGDITETIDPYTGENTLDLGNNYSSSNGQALIELTDDVVIPVYFRMNAFVPPIGGGKSESEEIINTCACLNIDSDKKLDYEYTINGGTDILIDDISTPVEGGGGMESGIPPTILTPKEPLAISVVDKRVNDESSSVLVFDGVSVNEIVLEVTFSGLPVPDGTPIYLSVYNQDTSLIQLSSDIIYTTQSIDENIDPNNIRSYAAIVLPLITPQQVVKELIRATTKYDKSGEVDREMSVCITITFDPEKFKKGDTINDIFSGALERFNITTPGSWQSKQSMINPRAEIVLESVSDKLYAIGGLSSSAISKFVEEYDPSTDEWNIKANMPTARLAAMSVVVNGKIYVIGGLSAGFVSTELEISDVIEVYDPDLDNWSGLSEMPVGLAFGVAHYINVSGNDRIYILGGLTEITVDGDIGKINDSIYYYDIDANEWIIDKVFLSSADLGLYQRISPISFVNGNSIVCFAGAVEVEERPVAGRFQTGTIKKLIYPSDSFSYDVTTQTLSVNDGNIGILPSLRHRVKTVSNGNDHYAIGGSNTKSLTLKVFEKIDASVSPNTLTAMESLTKGRASVGAAMITDGDQYIYIAGGFQSGRSNGFLQLRTTLAKNGRMRLDGKQSVGINVSLVDEAGEEPNTDVTVKARGSLTLLDNEGTALEDIESDVVAENTETSQQKAVDTIDDTMAVYPVLFTSNEITVQNGSGTITLLPRSEDVINAIEQLETGALTTDILISGNTDDSNAALTIVQNETRIPYNINVELTVIDDFYYGQTLTSVVTSIDSTSGTSGISLLSGEVPDVIFMVDSSLDMLSNFNGIAVGDVNDDDLSDTLLDAALAAFKSLNQQLIDAKHGSDARVAIISFSDTASHINMDTNSNVIRTFTNPLSDNDGDHIRDVERVLSNVSASGTANYSVAFQEAISLVESMKVSKTNGNVIFISVGKPSDTNFDSYVSVLKGMVSNVRAFGVGSSVDLTVLQRIDPEAVAFTRADGLLDVFGGLDINTGNCKNGVDIGVAMQWSQNTSGISVASIKPLNNSMRSFSTDAGNARFSIIPEALGQVSQPVVSAFSDIEWIPQVVVEVGDNTGTNNETINIIDSLSNSIPFGGSAMMDALYEASQLLLEDDVSGVEKTTYLFTDNEANMSIKTVDQVIDVFKVINQEQKCPIIAANYSVVNPPTLSSSINTTDSSILEKLTDETGGDIVTVRSADFEDDLVNLFVGSTIGALGYGTYQFVWDIGSVVELNSIAMLFELFENTTGNWTIAISQDGYTFTEIDDEFEPDVAVDFSDLLVRYVKFTITLLTGFTASNDEVYELLPLPASPSVLQIEVEYSTPSESLLLFPAIDSANIPQQVVVSVDAENLTNNNIEVGVAKSYSTNWLDYQNNSQPHIEQNGKIFIPLRFGEENANRERLTKIDGFTFKTHYGRWDPVAIVSLYDNDGDIIDDSAYQLFPREGLVVFNDIQENSPYIDIRDQNVVRVGLRLINRSKTNPIKVNGIGYMYNTNINLSPPVEPIAPEAKSVTVSPDIPTPYAKISASYTFSDLNEDTEDTEDRIIHWYINGVRINYLDNLVDWNDTSDTADPFYSHGISFDTTAFSSATAIVSEARRLGQSLIKVGDEIYFTIIVNDGRKSSELVKSNVVTVAESPPVIESVSILSEDSGGKISSRISADKDAFVDFTLVADSSTNNSLIIWNVNGTEFKRGKLGTTKDIDTIKSGETSSLGVLALRFNNSLTVSVTPDTGVSTGTQITSSEKLVSNSLPEVSKVTITPLNPTSSQSLSITYSFSDTDVLLSESTQSDESTIKWYKSDSSTSNAFVEVTELRNSKIVASSVVRKYQKWKAVVTAFDGLDTGNSLESNMVNIL